MICFQHPITRFLARYVYNSHQQEYEKNLHRLYEEDEKQKMRYHLFKEKIILSVVVKNTFSSIPLESRGVKSLVKRKH